MKEATRQLKLIELGMIGQQSMINKRLRSLKDFAL